jgi:hypothetical protein
MSNYVPYTKVEIQCARVGGRVRHFVLPATGEGMSHAINEAGAAELPAVAVDDGAASEQLDGGAAGLLGPP